MRRFYFNNFYNDDLNLIVTSEISLPYTKEDIEEVAVEGRSGSYTIKKGTYPNKKIKMLVNLVTKNFICDFERILNWLDNIKDNRLVIDDRNKCYKVKSVNLDEIVRDLRVGASTTIQFTCEPFLEDIYEQELDITNSSSYYYYGTKEGEPLFKINGTGNIQLILNGEVVTFKNVTSEIIFDSKLMICTSNNTNFLFEGQFPLLIPGNNKIELVGNLTKVTMLPRTQYKN